MDISVLLEARNIVKDYPGVRALDDVNFSLKHNQIHALCGENGAGKSTLINVLSGFFPTSSYEGDILLEGKKVNFKNIRDACNSGIAVIHQELNLFNELSVAENIFMGNELHRYGILNWDEMNSQASQWIKKLKLEGVRPTTKINELGVGKQQLVEIARVLRLSDIKVLILDEPTASLTEKDTDILMDILRGLRDQGTAIIYISHKIDEVVQIADYATILRDGKTVGGGDISTLTKKDIIQMIVGREINELFPKSDHEVQKDCILEVRDFTVREKSTGKKVVDNVSFKLNRREILGIYGLIGAGRTELVSSVFGSNQWDRKGQVYLNGKKAAIRSPINALKNGLSYVTEDRKESGIIPTMNVRENSSIAFLDKFNSLFGIIADKETMEVSSFAKSLRVKTPNLETKIINLSGGNQQKVLLVRSLMGNIKIMILDEPTRGIDVGAKQEIYLIINSLIKENVSIIMVSSELPEILGMCDRVLVMSRGRITGEFENADRDITRERIMISATGTEFEG